MVGVTSSSECEDVAGSFIKPKLLNPTLYQLYVNNGRDISHLSSFKEEKEILLPIFSAWVVIETTQSDERPNTREVRAIQLDFSGVEFTDDSMIERLKKYWHIC